MEVTEIDDETFGRKKNYGRHLRPSGAPLYGGEGGRRGEPPSHHHVRREGVKGGAHDGSGVHGAAVVR